MTFEECAKELYRDLVLQAVMDSANRVTGSANRRKLIEEALWKAYREGAADVRRMAPNSRQRERWAFDDLQKEVGIWAAVTFAYSTTRSRAEHLKREAGEVLDAAGKPELGEELADCVILILGLAHMNQISLIDEIRTKFAICKERKWSPPDAQGVIEHVREEK